MGDHLIVLCKAYYIHLNSGKQVKINVFSDNPSYEAWISRLLEATAFARLAGPIQPFSALFAQIDTGTNRGPYVNSSPLPESKNGLPDDPDWVGMEPYPKFRFPAESVAPEQVVIQLNAGGAHNPRGFDIAWVLAVCRQLETSGIRTCILGTGTGYSKEQLQQLDGFGHIDNFVGKTDFDQWLATLAGASAVISLEGFAAYFALANGVRTAIFNQYPYFETKSALHESWLKHVRLQHLYHPSRYVRKIQSVSTRITRMVRNNPGTRRHYPKDISLLVQFLLLESGT